MSLPYPSYKQYWARELTETTVLDVREVTGTYDRVVGETRNRRGEVIAATTEQAKYNYFVTDKQNEYKCKYCGYEWIGHPY